jgi:predicted Zn-dependent peptidase
MKFRQIRVCFFLAAVLLAGGSAYAEQDFKDIEGRVTEFTLKNGMKFLVLERHQAPVASFFTSTIGTKDYAKEKAALAEVDKTYSAWMAEKRKGAAADAPKLKALESAFRDAQEAAGKYVEKNEFGMAVERAGGRGLNASTAYDATRYFFSLPSNQAELWFFLESERFRDPVLREFYKERDVVMEERRMRTESQPIGRLLEEFLHAAYIAHPYGEPIVGHMSDLQNITRADARAFFEKYYTPANLTCVVAGDVDPKRMRALAETYFGRIPAAPKPEPIRTVEPPQNAQRRVKLELQSQRILVMGYHKPDINDPDAAVYDAIASLMSEGRSSRLYRSLVRDKKIAVQAAGFPGLPGLKYPGLFIFYSVPARGHTNEESEQVIAAELERLKTEPVRLEELDGVKRRARANLIRGLSDNTGLAMQLANWQVLTGDWRNLFRQIERINAVTPDDIQRVARKVFVNHNLTVGTIEPLETAQAK